MQLWHSRGSQQKRKKKEENKRGMPDAPDAAHERLNALALDPHRLHALCVWPCDESRYWRWLFSWGAHASDIPRLSRIILFCLCLWRVSAPHRIRDNCAIPHCPGMLAMWTPWGFQKPGLPSVWEVCPRWGLELICGIIRMRKRAWERRCVAFQVDWFQ